MTWKQLKEEIERHGVTDEMTIDFIDVTYPGRDEIVVELPTGVAGVQISSMP